MENKFDNPNSEPVSESEAASEPEEVSDEYTSENMKTDIFDILLEMYNLELENLTDEQRKIFDNYAMVLTRSVIISGNAGHYWKNIIPNSIRKPENGNGYSADVQPDIFFEENKLELAKKLGQVSEFNNLKVDYQSQILEEEGKENIKQVSYNRFLKNDGKVIIEEIVTNYLTEEHNLAFSNLVITDPQASCKLEIGKLLPEGYTLSPSELIGFEQKINSELQRIETVFHRFTLDKYKGTKNSDSEFYHFLNFKKVCYGDVVKKGGALSLFHEIAHAWQQVYRGEHERGNFEKFHSDATIWLAILKNKYEELNSGKMNEDSYEFYFNHIKTELEKLGIEFDPDNFIYDGQALEQGSLILTRFDGSRFVVKCENFPKIMEAYEKCERDAWAHAILMFRYLKKFGINLEPEFKSFDDFRKYIDPCLDSYQKSTESMVEIVGGRVGFLKRKK